MHVENTIHVQATVAQIFPLAAEVERWPEMFPHYRFVTVLSESREGRLVEMAAWRGWIPIRWRAIQRVDRSANRIEFRHVWGATRGMKVEWRLEPANAPDCAGDHQHPATTRINLVHDLALSWPILGPTLADKIVGPMFVDYVAARTLRCLKVLAEAEHAHAVT